MSKVKCLICNDTGKFTNPFDQEYDCNCKEIPTTPDEDCIGWLAEENKKLKAEIDTLKANRAETQVSFAEPNQQLFTVNEVMSFLESQRQCCAEAYRENTEDYQIYDNTLCAIENAPLPIKFLRKQQQSEEK